MRVWACLVLFVLSAAAGYLSAVQRFRPLCRGASWPECKLRLGTV